MSKQMSIEEERQVKQLVEGLVGDRLKLYLNNAHFYHAINALADMLPYWVNGIAAEAERRGEEIYMSHLLP